MLDQIIKFLKYSEAEIIAYNQQDNSAGINTKAHTARWGGRWVAVIRGPAENSGGPKNIELQRVSATEKANKILEFVDKNMGSWLWEVILPI